MTFLITLNKSSANDSFTLKHQYIILFALILREHFALVLMQHWFLCRIENDLCQVQNSNDSNDDNDDSQRTNFDHHSKRPGLANDTPSSHVYELSR